MAGNLELKQAIKGEKTLISLRGKIDESAKFGTPKFEGIKVAIFDFDEVKAINSMGIQAWIAFLKKVPESVRVVFQRCPLRIINQINLFPGFLAGRKISIVSFYAPYFCDPCDEAFSFLLKTKESFPKGKPLKVPRKECGKCGEALEFGALEEKYLIFLKRARAS